MPYLLRHGVPIRYSYVGREWALPFYQTVFAREPGSAEMPSASRPFTPSVVTALVARGVLIAPLTLHTGVSSLEAGEDPYPEPYDVPPATARLVNHVRAHGGRIIAAGTTVVRALETAALDRPAARWRPRRAGRRTWSRRRPGSRWWTGCSPGCTSRVLRTCGCWPRSPDPELLSRCYETAIRSRYLWHEFGDVHLLLP